MVNAMSMSKLESTLERLYKSPAPKREDIENLLAVTSTCELNRLFEYADQVRKNIMGDGVLVRGIVEFSNLCSNHCAYCGLHSANKDLERYRMTTEEIIDSVKNMASFGIKTVVLQSGEDHELDPVWIKALIEEIKRQYGIAVTLALGEWSKDEYRLWRDAGADRYLLKIETTNKDHYEALHPGMSFENRLRCLSDLRELGYQAGSGVIVGLKGQTIGMLAKDILFFAKERFDMIGIGPFIPHPETRLSDERLGDGIMTLKVLALTRIITKRAHLPATTALGNIANDMRSEALKCGANVMMPNFTPDKYKAMYELYPRERYLHDTTKKCVDRVSAIASSAGRQIDYSRGDAI